jgi:DNA-directed RNA polymerase subunit K/omega
MSAKKANLSFSSDSGDYDPSDSFSGSDDFADILDDEENHIKPKRKVVGGDDHPDRDPDDEAEETDGPDDVDTDGEFDPVTNEELADIDDDNENESENDEDVESDGDNEGDDDDGEEGDDYNVKSKRCYLSGLDSNSIVIDDDSNVYEKMVSTRIPDDKRTTGPEMTIYEVARVVGNRAQQFNRGALPLIDGVDDLIPTQKAYIELITKQTPMIIQRRLPGKRYEEWKIEEMDIIHRLTDEYFLPQGFDIEIFKAKFKIM